MKWRVSIKGKALPGALVLGLWGCSPSSAPPPDPNAVIARFSGGEIRRSDISEAVERRLASERNQTPDARKIVVRRIVERRVRIAMLEAEAKAKGFAQSAQARSLSAAATERVLAEHLIARQTASVRAADAQVAEAVESRMKRANPGEARKFSHIYLRAEAANVAGRKAAEAKMQRILAELKGGADFNALAQRYSDSVDARAGGRVEWTVAKDLRPTARSAVFTLQEGKVSGVDATSDGLHLYRLDAVRGGARVNPEAVRAAVRKELDEEARAAAARDIRQAALDSAGVEFAPLATIGTLKGAADTWVARWKGGRISASDLRNFWNASTDEATQLAPFLRELVENRLLAAALSRKDISNALAAQLATAEKDALLNAYRSALVAEADVVPDQGEIALFYRENAESALFLRDHRLDVLFFRQTGGSASGVYSSAQKVVASLREGVAFDRVLARPPATSMVCRDVHGLDLETLGRRSPRLRRSILNLGPGEVSEAIYLEDTSAVSRPGNCLFRGRGVAFVRLRETKALPLKDVEGTIRQLLLRQKVRSAIDAVQARLISESKLTVLIPEG